MIGRSWWRWKEGNAWWTWKEGIKQLCVQYLCLICICIFFFKAYFCTSLGTWWQEGPTWTGCKFLFSNNIHSLTVNLVNPIIPVTFAARVSRRDLLESWEFPVCRESLVLEDLEWVHIHSSCGIRQIIQPAKALDKTCIIVKVYLLPVLSKDG